MAFGFKSISTNGNIVQIDQDFKNFVLVEKATVVTDTNLSSVSGHESSYKTVTYSSGTRTYPVIATNSSMPVFIIQQNSTQCSFVAKGTSGQSLTYYIFDQIPSTPPNTGFGLKVLLANGETAYADTYKYMRVLGAHSAGPFSWAYGNVGSSAGSIASGVGLTLAAVQSMPGVRQMATSGVGGPGTTPAATMAGGSFQSGDTLQVQCIQVFTFNNSVGFDTGGTTGSWLGLDVTNY